MPRCQNCGTWVPGKAPSGSGTQNVKDVPTNFNRNQLLLLLDRQIGPRTVRGLQADLFQYGFVRQGRASWNYHTIQADLSILVGKGLVKMTPTKGRAFLYEAVPKAEAVKQA